MENDIERNLGPQPIAAILETLELKTHDLVGASTEQITHKMVTKACKGRRLSTKVKIKIMNALNTCAKKEYKLNDLFNYR